MDVDPLEITADGRGTEGKTSTKESPGRKSPLRDSRRNRGTGRRGYWVGRRQQQIQGRIRSEQRGANISKDIKSNRETKVKGPHQGLRLDQELE